MAKQQEEVRRALRTAAARVPDVLARGTRLVVAFSGGQDSTCLLHALAHCHRQLELVAGHIDHGLRPESADEALRVQALAQHIGVACEVRRVEVARHPPGGSVQQAARLARYRALAHMAEERQATAVMVAHTADDQAETLLLHLLRGAGLTGLSGMRLDETLELVGTEAAQVRLVRPLLRVPRATTLAYCHLLGLPLVEDASNEVVAYARNRVRLELMPMLERFNPAIRSVLARTADLAAEDNSALEAITAALDATVNPYLDHNLGTFRSQPRALQRRLLRRRFEALVGSTIDLPDAPIEDALDLLESGQPEQTYHLPYGVELHVGSSSFRLRLDGAAQQRTGALQKNWDGEVPSV